ncbi:hypothetical protein CROQUDRAFT_97791 [Cronartium quercuum f. sp. fusiforme G11]|uniref:Uncharacterized protein n=1 Tax=Cronartium quercuum f. sp. fusiforme G11 TaxID=708437 RepID=A0A9P6NAA9_9BASI|nr:hypothetical protein CROQUDRAFT_97791 [Cronartium quercuum f. sp. fusiforme G11]
MSHNSTNHELKMEEMSVNNEEEQHKDQELTAPNQPVYPLAPMYQQQPMQALPAQQFQVPGYQHQGRLNPVQLNPIGNQHQPELNHPAQQPVQNQQSLPPPVPVHLASAWDNGITEYYSANLQWWQAFHEENNNPAALLIGHSAVTKARSALHILENDLHIPQERIVQEIQTWTPVGTRVWLVTEWSLPSDSSPKPSPIPARPRTPPIIDQQASEADDEGRNPRDGIWRWSKSQPQSRPWSRPWSKTKQGRMSVEAAVTILVLSTTDYERSIGVKSHSLI